jgi:parvulin-like peptidyl-prolyl isomerase
MWLRPGLAQELIEMARVRMQSPDGSASAPQFNAGSYPLLPSNIPGSNLPGAPVQPMPASRPASWPGGPEASTPVYNPVRAAPQSNSMPIVSPPPGAMPVMTLPPASMAVMQPAQAGPIGQYQPAAVQPPVVVANQVVSQYAQSTYPQTPYPQTQFQPQLIPAGPGSAAPSSAALLPGSSAIAPPGYSPAIPPEAALSPNPNMQNLQVLPTQPEEFKDAQVVARIGTEVILASDRDTYVAEFLESKKIQIPPDQMEDALKILNRQILKQMIDAKLVYNDAIHTIPKEGITQITASINKDFDKEQLPDLLKANSAASPQELDQKLRAKGSSLDRARRVYIEKKLMYGWIGKQVNQDEQVPLASILGNYEEHLEDYKFAAQARWEELMVSFDRFPNKQSAYAALAEMGNQVMQGSPFAEVAKTSSQGPTAPDGGTYDWTNQGSLGAKELDQAIFGADLALNSLSQIIETKTGFHIIRVLERKPGGKKSFEDAQGEIKKKIKDENREKQVNKFLDDLRKKTQVWTIYDDQPGGIDGPKKAS